MTTPAAAPGATGTGTSLEIVTPKAGEQPRTNGLKAVGGSENTQALPPVEKPAAPEDTVNDIAPGQKTPAAQQAPEIARSASGLLRGARLSLYGQDSSLVASLTPVLNLLADTLRSARPGGKAS